MKPVLSLAAAAFVIFGAVHPAGAATVKTRKGALVEGEIAGLLVQKGDASISDRDGKKRFGVTYHLSNGRDIATIDEAGVTKNAASVAFCNVSQADKPPDDLDAVETCLNMPAGAFLGGYTKSGGQVVRLGGASAKAGVPNRDSLLGEYKSEAGKGRIVPFVTVKTAAGEVKIATVDVVAFSRSDALTGTSPGQTSPGVEGTAAPPGAERLPVTRVHEGRERITLFMVYKVAKWDLGSANTYVHVPNDDEELIVVRFYRQPVTPGAELPVHAVSLLGADSKRIPRLERLWRLSAGAWAEWVFVGKTGSALGTVNINGASFDLTGLAIPSEPLPREQ